MTLSSLTIPTENPEQEQWRLLNRLTFSANIKRNMAEQGHADVADKTVDYISGCLRQSEAYFKAAKAASLDISPLLLYYGTTNLLAGASAIMKGEKLAVQGHGMKLEIPEKGFFRIADVEVKPVNSANGGLQLFSDVFSDGSKLVNGEAWSFEEIVGSIPDARQEFLLCYESARPFSIPLQAVKTEQGLLDRIELSEFERFNAIGDALENVVRLNQGYLAPQFGGHLKYVILRPKLGAEDICIYSLFGKRFLPVNHIKAAHSINLSQLIAMTMGLYALGFLSRYNPEIWNSFIRLDSTGEVLLLVKFLAICQRFIPNMVLDYLHGRRHLFTSQADEAVDLTALSSTRELNKQIREQVNEELNKRGIYK